MADVSETKSSATLGTFTQWDPQSRQYLIDTVGEEKWPELRQKIAEYRSGASTSMPVAGDAGNRYYGKTPDDQSMLNWIMEYLSQTAVRPPSGNTQYKGSTSSDEFLDEARRLAGGR